MARGINKVILLGNLGADPELRYTASQKAVANLRVATTEEWKDRNTGEKQSKTEWHRVVAWGPLAEICGQYMSKGDQVYVEGMVQSRKYESGGQEKFITEIMASTVLKTGMGQSDEGAV